jgi:hypothetical protein
VEGVRGGFQVADRERMVRFVRRRHAAFDGAFHHLAHQRAAFRVAAHHARQAVHAEHRFVVPCPRHSLRGDVRQ